MKSSKVKHDLFVDNVIKTSDGVPMMVFHGSDCEFDQFKPGVSYFTPRTDYSYIRNSLIVYPCYISIKNPFYADNASFIEMLRSFPERVNELQEKGYDGVVYAKKHDLMKGLTGWGDDYSQFVVFNNTQIHSAFHSEVVSVINAIGNQIDSNNEKARYLGALSF